MKTETIPYVRYTTAARRYGLTPDCVRQAMNRGAIAFVVTQDGMRLVKSRDVAAHARRDFGRGRPRTVVEN